MLTYTQASAQLIQKLQPLYDQREAVSITNELLEHITGADRLQRIIDKDKLLTDEQYHQYTSSTEKLLQGKPLQYVTHKAYFLGRSYYVNEHVLIPRPETEELVDWIISDHHEDDVLSIIDIGTGSGCIPISIKIQLQHSKVEAIDISEKALEVAQKNSVNLKTDVAYLKTDFLNSEGREQLDLFDIIISNPPYIPQNELETLHTNVRDHEPHTALFVPDNDPLLFYRLIAQFGKTHLNNNGSIYCELHVDYAEQTKDMFVSYGYHSEIRKDMHGNWRMLKATK